MTIKEAIEITMNQLKAISIPIGMYDQIGAPLTVGVKNLQEILIAIDSVESEKENAPAVTEEEI